MSYDQACRVCGCTDDDGCVTAAGILDLAFDPDCELRPEHVCHWIEDDLCSVCAFVINPPKAAQGDDLGICV